MNNDKRRIYTMAIQSYLLIGAGVIGVLGLLTFTLPQKVHVEREAIINAEPDTLRPLHEISFSNLF